MLRSSLDGPSYAQSQDRSWIGAAMDYCLAEIVRTSRKRKPLTRKSKYVIMIARESQLAMGPAKANMQGTVCHAATRWACRKASSGGAGMTNALLEGSKAYQPTRAHASECVFHHHGGSIGERDEIGSWIHPSKSAYELLRPPADMLPTSKN